MIQNSSWTRKNTQDNSKLQIYVCVSDLVLICLLYPINFTRSLSFQGLDHWQSTKVIDVLQGFPFKPIIKQWSDKWSDICCSQYMYTEKAVLPNLDNQQLLSVSSPSILLHHFLSLVVWENKFPALMSLLPKCCYWNGSVYFALWCHLPHSQLGIIESNIDSQSWE